MRWESWLLVPIFKNYLFTVVQIKERFSNSSSVDEHLSKEVHGTSQLRLVVGGSATL